MKELLRKDPSHPMNSTVSHDSERPESILQELKGSIADSQSALLEGDPQELENCI